MIEKKHERKIIALAITDNADHTSETVRFGEIGNATGVVLIENSLNQIVATQLQARAAGGTQWFDAGAAVNAAALAGAVKGTNTISITVPYPLLRVICTCAVAPASGSVDVFLCRVRG